jgi:hypothetical protein
VTFDLATADVRARFADPTHTQPGKPQRRAIMARAFAPIFLAPAAAGATLGEGRGTRVVRDGGAVALPGWSPRGGNGL